MIRDAIRSTIAILAFTVLLGLGYPIAVWAAAQVAFGHSADGSLVTADGRVVGSSLIGQAFSGAGYFHSRPSAVDYDAAGSAASNLGPNSEQLSAEIRKRSVIAAAANGVRPHNVPVDLVTASGSGLDPDISEPAALLQVRRIARERGLSETAVRTLVEDHVIEPTLGFLGAKRINVLSLNLALDSLTR